LSFFLSLALPVTFRRLARLGIKDAGFSGRTQFYQHKTIFKFSLKTQSGQTAVSNR